MELDDELLSRIRAAISLNKAARVSDFQMRTGKNGSVLINLKTGHAQLIYDDASHLRDSEELGVSEDGSPDFLMTLNL